MESFARRVSFTHSRLHLRLQGRLNSAAIMASLQAQGSPTQIRHRDPHGCVPESSSTALVLIDVINDFAFPRGRQLLRAAIPAAHAIARLKEKLRRRKIPAIYVNDNFGRWQSDFRSQYRKCASEDSLGAPVVRLLEPATDDYFVLKPKHSGFYSTSLEILLRYLGAKRLILTGFAADICVLFTANDAYMRGFELIVPSDCVAAETTKARQIACALMKRFLRADIRRSSAITGRAVRNRS
jgi:nicotinamidase-related amidase